MGHSCGTLLWLLQDTLVRHLVGHFCGTLLWDTLVGHSWGSTLVGHSCGALLLKSSKSTVTSPKRVSFETLSKSHTSSLQNEHSFRSKFTTHYDNESRTRLYPQTTRRVTREPFAMHSFGKMLKKKKVFVVFFSIFSAFGPSVCSTQTFHSAGCTTRNSSLGSSPGQS